MIDLNTDLEILPFFPLIFIGGRKVQNLAFETFWFWNGAT